MAIGPTQTFDPAADYLRALYPVLVTLPAHLQELTRAVQEKTVVDVRPEFDTTAILEALARLGEAIGRLEQAPSQEATNQQWDQLLEQLRDVAKKVGARQHVAAIGMPNRDDFPLPGAQYDTLEAHLNNIKQQTDTLETLLTTIQDNQFRRTDPLAAGTNIVGYVSPTVSKKVGEAKFFIADSGQIATDVTNNWCNFTFQNPAGSGKNAYIVAVTLEFDTTVFARFYLNPTTNLPTTARTAYNGINLLSSAPYASSMVVKANAVANQMDNATTLVSRVTSNVGVQLQLPPMIVTPGNVIGFGGNLGGVGNASVAVYWYEEPA